MAKGSKEVTVSKGKLERMPRPGTLGDLESMFEDFFGRRFLRPFDWGLPAIRMPAMPSVDVIDRDDEVVVRAEVPGYRKEQIDIAVSDNSLTIKGETKTEEKEEKGDYYRSEISHGSFVRTLALPAQVDGDKVKAAMKDGLLEITLPKVAKSKRHAVKID